jgi:hypothetical protein
MEDAERTTDRRPNRHKAGAKYPGHSNKFIIYSGNMRWKGISWGREHVFVILRNKRNL